MVNHRKQETAYSAVVVNEEGYIVIHFNDITKQYTCRKLVSSSVPII